jgi:hypothetical protein
MVKVRRDGVRVVSSHSSGSQIAGYVRAVEGARIWLDSDIEMGLGNESCRGLFRRVADDVKLGPRRRRIERLQKKVALGPERGAAPLEWRPWKGTFEP